MKKIFLFLSIVFFGLLGNAQTITREEARTICAKQMSAFTTVVSPAFKQGISYDQFQATVCAKWIPTVTGKNQLKAAYNYLSKGVSNAEIIKTYSGTEIAASFQFLSESNKKGIKSDGSELFGGKTGTEDNIFGKAAGGCRWYEFWCHVQVFANWVVQNWPVIAQIITFFLNL